MQTSKLEIKSYRSIRVLAIISFAYIVVLSLVSLFLPTTGWPTTTAPTILSLILMALMPVELPLLYLLYQFLGPKTDTTNIVGNAALLYAIGITPAIYGCLISFTDSFSRFLGVTMGWIFSFAGVFLAWTLLNRLGNEITPQTPYHD